MTSRRAHIEKLAQDFRGKGNRRDLATPSGRSLRIPDWLPRSSSGYSGVGRSGGTRVAEAGKRAARYRRLLKLDAAAAAPSFGSYLEAALLALRPDRALCSFTIR